MRLNVWYEGAKIEVGKYYNPEHLIINLLHDNGKRDYIPWQDCLIDSYRVTKEGLNFFTATYIINDTKKISNQFVVEGVVFKDYEDLDFKVIHITDDGITDMTEEFNPHFEVTSGHYSFSWTNFLQVVNELQLLGKYIITIPKKSGLSNKYDMDWEVLCINETTLKANIKKIYKEEENHG